MLARNAVVASQVAFGLVPEILDAVDVVAVLDELFAVIDAMVTELRHIENVVAAQPVGVDDAVGFDGPPDDRKQRIFLDVWNDKRVNLALPFQQPKHRHLARRAASALAFAGASEIALIDFDLTGQKRRLLGNLGGDDLSQLMEEQRRGVAMDPRQFRRRTRRRAGHKLADQFFLNTGR